jgi:cholesterol transport system auxiliary component
MMKVPFLPLLALLALLALPGCISLTNEPPESLMTLTPAATVQAGTSRNAVAGQAVALSTPEAPESLRTTRVAVQASDTGIAYLKDALWVGPPAQLFRRLLSETIAARTGRIVVDPLAAVDITGARLSGELKSFGLDGPRQEAVVVYDASLMRADAPVEVRRFEARVPVAAADVTNVAPALNEAANRVAADVADWIAR